MIAQQIPGHVELAVEFDQRRRRARRRLALTGVLVYLVVVSGGLQSPLLPTQLLFTTLFVMLFPRPIAIVPPLLTFPVVAKIQEILSNGQFSSTDRSPSST